MEEKEIYKKAFSLLKKAIENYGLLNENERFIIGVSGGKDSLCLTHLLNEYNKRENKNWDFICVYVKPDFINFDIKRLIKFFEKHNIKYEILETNISDKIRTGKKSPCFFCSRERKRILFNFADKLNINKVAFAHHLEDVNETFLLNLFFNSEVSTFLPKQDFFDGKFYIIRPLYFFTTPLIKNYNKIFKIKPIRNPCPYIKENKREEIRKFLEKYYKIDERIRENIFKGIKNIKEKYLP
ncbi:MAG: tRNA 2-thiocytidine biosynthesis TtcA family protein [candidate division WOR-3 bacterium]|nr:tRNA 2-thiocytidine biosynthesis TtcA family protein [candidate division WOR-3 bacterium]MCX7837063.1 tRNA 2-thiocytidine biosynthesis TtcA family protein [candidate division WOR-3 bacterium]MDW8114235.1 tRNA 2-thiocytidine biosynthesis TtcA family protein [candidate division WOR-3 bacterium]